MKREGGSLVNPLFWTFLAIIFSVWGASIINYFVSIAIKRDITEVIRTITSS